jgi:PAS domain S-box-containing protein
MSSKIISKTNSLLSVIRQETTFLKAALFLSVVLLAGNLNAIVDSVLHPEIPYFDTEHIIVGSIYALFISILLMGIGIYTIRQKQSDKMLSESEDIFNNFMEHSPIYVFFKDENIRSLQLSRNFETMLNRPLAELLGKSMNELFPSALAKSMVEDDKRIMSEGKTLNIEEELNGRLYQTIKFPINIEGKPRYLAGYAIDITERKKAEEALQQYSVELEKSNKELQDALAKVKQLSEMLPICASCKKIRDDKGYWQHIEAYISEHTDTLFSHGICPDCEKRAYEELNRLKNKKT